ncbi:glycosyltransferase family 2 protein [candidate division KSB1 bacterium]|nr:glycosyltransferase family 2 protein [candidate division KSB1 bacterium]
MSARPCVTVILVTYHSKDHVGACLKSLREFGGPWLSGIVVVDNASQDGTADWCRQNYPDVVVIANPENVGFGTGVNRGAMRAESEFLLILNPDTEIDAMTIGELVALLDSRPLAGAVGPRIVNGSGKFDYSARRGFPRPLAALAYAARLDRVFPRSPTLAAYQMPGVSPEREVMTDSLSGCCMLVRRAAFEQIGGFDEDYFLYGEDIDLCWKLAAVGLERWYVPTARVLHVKGASMKFATDRARREFFRAMNIFVDKRLSAEYSVTAVRCMHAGIAIWKLLSRR